MIEFDQSWRPFNKSKLVDLSVDLFWLKSFNGFIFWESMYSIFFISIVLIKQTIWKNLEVIKD